VVFGVGGAVEAGLGDFDEYQVDDDHREEQQEEGRWAWRESQQVGESGVGQDRTDQRRTGRNREHGQARSALEERYASAGGRILIVGSRGRGGLAGLLLGRCRLPEHAVCPVVVVATPPPR
jgi:hypothetical protein